MPALVTRRIAGILTLLACSCLWGASALGATFDPRGFNGTVRDPIGNVLADVEVLVMSQAAAAVRPLAATASDGAGRFNIPGLVPGVYRIAALKDGYRTFIGRVDTQAEGWVQLILYPASGPGAGPTPGDGSWALRLPRISVFRETDAGATTDASVKRSRRKDAPVKMQVAQVFAAGSPGATERDSQFSERGTEVSVAGALGERGSIRVHGNRQRRDASWAESDATARRDASHVSVDFSYDTGVDGQLEIQAFYSARDVELDGSLVQPDAAIQQSQEVWGYRSEWSRQLDAGSRIAVELDYDDRSQRVPLGLTHAPLETDALLEGLSPAWRKLSDRWISAGGTYDLRAAPDHRVQLGLSASLLDAPWLTGGSLGPEPAVSLRLEAEDAWSITRPLTLIYGLGYRHTMTSAESTLLVPRIGGVWTVDGVVVSVVMSYHELTYWRGGETSDGVVREGQHDFDSAFEAPAPQRPALPLGYAASVELPLGEGFRVRGHARRVPVEFDELNQRRNVLQAARRPLYLSDGHAAVDETGLTLVQDAGTTRTYVELTRGRAEGMLASTLPWLGAIPRLSQGQLEFRNGRWGVRMEPHGTDLQFEYRRVRETPAFDLIGRAATEEESYELRLTQDLQHMPSLGAWRLLMAVRMATLENEAGQDLLAEERGVLLDSWNRGISAGLSVSF